MYRKDENKEKDTGNDPFKKVSFTTCKSTFSENLSDEFVTRF